MKKSFPSTAALLGASLLSSAAVAADSAPAFPELDIKPMPASCRLLPAELRRREATLLADLGKRIENAVPLTDG
jgi:hypothetical protein